MGALRLWVCYACDDGGTEELRDTWMWREKWWRRCVHPEVAPVIEESDSSACYVHGFQPGLALGPRTEFGKELLARAAAARVPRMPARGHAQAQQTKEMLPPFLNAWGNCA